MGYRGEGREGGVLGVGGASILYGLAYSLRHGDPGPLLLVSLAAAATTMMLTGPAWRLQRTWRLLLMVPPGFLYAIVIAERVPDSIPFALASAALAIAALLLDGVPLILVGGPLVATAGGLIALAGGSGPLAPLVPVAYTLLTVSIAAGIVLGDWRRTALHTGLGGLAVLASGMGLCLSNCGLAGGLLLADALARLVLVPTGLLQRVPIALYGYHEAVHTTIVWLAVALACPAM